MLGHCIRDETASGPVGLSDQIVLLDQLGEWTFGTNVFGNAQSGGDGDLTLEMAGDMTVVIPEPSQPPMLLTGAALLTLLAHRKTRD